ncbi:hypothetical protein [Mesonia sp.]|uniref:hypothetical protein n=1 Tax=Mesonia sp. TaxID=1960830 RepID=UPI001768949E|nr:hypothetical protein [Mesonia sp.]HIB37116.1 hypothetical protein [Mesonia sp.]
MKVKEFYYEGERISTIRNSITREVSSVKKTSDKLYCYLLKRHYKAENVVIDYNRKIAFLQYSISNNHITDERILVANTRIAEVHYRNLKSLLLACMPKNRNSSIYRQIRGNQNRTILTFKN